ncbi:MAG TPA: hypothetical protein VMN57_12590, partial [Anaerolineales bacterium]|nr:hypothetical protein [Anaerolineales bacterium]
LKIGSTVQLGEYSFLVMKDSTICGSCGETVRSDDRYCQYCGNSLIAPELRPDQGKVGEPPVEEPFPETTPVPIVDEISGGLQTPKFNTPPDIPVLERPAVVAKPAPPQAPPPAQRSAIAPPAPPAPQPTAIKKAVSPEAEKKAATWRMVGIIAVLSLCGLAGLAVIIYSVFNL